jgi:hypothetical protein
MDRKEGLKITNVMMKFFGVTNYIMQWYEEATEDKIISVEELANLGAGVCRLLGITTALDITEEK